MTSDEIIAELRKKVKENYSPRKCGWTAERSMGNYDDCFDDGSENGSSWTWYEVGQILGMKLPEPEKSDDE